MTEMVPPAPAGAISAASRSRIKEALYASDVTQRQIAEELGVEEGTVSKWLRRRVPMPLRAIEHISKRTGVSVDRLLGNPLPKYDAVVAGDNVAGVIEQEERDSWREREVYDSLGAASLLMELGTPKPIGKERPPAKYEARIGPSGIGFRVQGESMAGWPKRPIFDGDTVWVNREDERWVHGVVVAIVEKAAGDDLQAVVKFHDGEGGLWGYPAGGVRQPYPVHKIHTMTPAIIKTSPPGEF